MPLENQNNAPEKNVESTKVSDLSSANMSSEAMTLLQDNSIKESESKSDSNLTGVLPDSNNILNQDQETREAFGLESDKTSNSIDENGQLNDKAKEDVKDNGDIKDGRADSTENPKAETSADQANAHDSTEVDHQDGETKTDNKEVAAHKDGKDKKGKSGDADKDTDDGVDNQAGEKIADNAKSGQPGGEANNLGSNLSNQASNSEANSADKTLDKKSAEKASGTEAGEKSFESKGEGKKSESEDNADPANSPEGSEGPGNKPEAPKTESDSEGGESEAPKSDSSDSDSESKQEPPKDLEKGVDDFVTGVKQETFGDQSDNAKHPPIEAAQMPSSEIDRSNSDMMKDITSEAGSDSYKNNNQAENSIIAAQSTINSGLNSASTAALYERSISLS